jgi:PASTA domain-containing protein
VNWQIWVGPAVGLAGLLFAVYTYNKNRKPKRLQYEIRTDQEIVSHSRYTRWADLSVRFGDRDLKRPRVVVVRVTNTGKVEARADDFDEPLGVSATGGAEIIAATIALRQQDTEESQEVEPTRLDATEVVAPKVLLNESEWLEFRLLVDGEKQPVRLRGRAAGFSLTTSAPRRRLSLRPELLATVIGAAAAAAVSIAFSAAFANTVPVPNLVGKPVEQAVSQINDAGLKLGTVNRVRSSAPAGFCHLRVACGREGG